MAVHDQALLNDDCEKHEFSFKQIMKLDDGFRMSAFLKEIRDGDEYDGRFAVRVEDAGFSYLGDQSGRATSTVTIVFESHRAAFAFKLRYHGEWW